MRKFQQLFCPDLDTQGRFPMNKANHLWQAVDIFLETGVFKVQDLIATVCDNLGHEEWDDDFVNLLEHLQNQIEYCRDACHTDYTLGTENPSVIDEYSVRGAMRKAGIEFSSAKPEASLEDLQDEFLASCASLTFDLLKDDDMGGIKTRMGIDVKAVLENVVIFNDDAKIVFEVQGNLLVFTFYGSPSNGRGDQLKNSISINSKPSSVAKKAVSKVREELHLIEHKATLHGH